MTILFKYSKYLLSAAIIVVGIIMGLAKQEDLFSNFLLWVIGLRILTRLTLLLAIIALSIFLWKRRIGKILSYGLVIGCSSIVSLQIFFEIGVWTNQWKLDTVENYVARAVPILDKIKQREGAYPTNLPADLLGEEPELLRDDGYYAATTSSFCFEFIDEPAGWAGGDPPLEFDSTNRVWRYDDGGGPAH